MLIGMKRYLLFGSVYGFFIWIVIRNFLNSISVPGGLLPLNAASIAVSLPSHLLWGLLTGIIIKYFALKYSQI